MRISQPQMRMKVVPGLSRLRFAVFGLLIAVSMGGCVSFSTIESNKIPQEEIRQSYTIRASKGETASFATFSRGEWGASVDLDGQSRIENNGVEMAQRSNLIFAGTHYARRVTGVEKLQTFTYTNNNGKKFTNSIRFEPIEIVSGNVEISRTSETRIGLSRNVASDEKLRITLTSSQSRPDNPNGNIGKGKKRVEPDYEIVLNDELDASRAAFVIKPKNISNFVIGGATLKIEVSRTEELKQVTAAGGSIESVYESIVTSNVVR